MYYCIWLLSIQDFPLVRLKFLDEASFESGDCRRRRGVAKKGRRLMTVAPLRSVTYNLTLLASLTAPNGIVLSELRQGSNNAYDFCLFIVGLLDAGHLADGDILVVDNASIHKAADMMTILDPLLDAFGVRMLFLPTYSPELNPCELCFAQVKRQLREGYQSADFAVDIANAFAALTLANVWAYYSKCVLDAGAE